jgi:hypothetical protein
MTRRAAVAKKIALFIQFLLLYSIFQTAYKPSPTEKDTHSVQNPNAKVSIILTVFNKFNIGWAWLEAPHPASSTACVAG